MKKIIILLSIALAIVACGTTNSVVNDDTFYINPYTDEVLDGIFKLRLGMSEEDLRAIVDSSSIYNEKYYKESSNPDGTYKEKLEKLWVREYIPTYGSDNTPAPKYKIKFISFEFHDNKVYRIWFEDDSGVIEPMLTQKYGEPTNKKGSYKSKSTGTKKIPGYQETKKDSYDTYTTKTYEDTYVTYDYTYKRKYTDKIWRTNHKDITCEASRYKDQPYSNIRIENERIKQESLSTRYAAANNIREEERLAKEKQHEQLKKEF